MRSSRSAMAGFHACWRSGGARWAAIGCVVLAASAGCTAGTSSTGPGSTASPAGHGSPTPASSSSGHSPPCPATPVAGPAHTLTFPSSIDGYQKADGPSGDQELAPYKGTDCNAPAQDADYQNSQGSFITVEVGHHASLWPTFNDFWGEYFEAGGNTIVPVPAGSLGGQAGCGTSAEGTVCNWLDNDTFGSFVGDGPSMSQSQTASLMVTFRNAVEQAG